MSPSCAAAPCECELQPEIPKNWRITHQPRFTSNTPIDNVSCSYPAALQPSATVLRRLLGHSASLTSFDRPHFLQHQSTLADTMGKDRKVAEDFQKLIQADREKKKNEALAARIFNRTSTPVSTPKQTTGGSLASRAGVKKVCSQLLECGPLDCATMRSESLTLHGCSSNAAAAPSQHLRRTTTRESAHGPLILVLAQGPPTIPPSPVASRHASPTQMLDLRVTPARRGGLRRWRRRSLGMSSRSSRISAGSKVNRGASNTSNSTKPLPMRPRDRQLRQFLRVLAARDLQSGVWQDLLR